ncbi:MAG: GNAT family N-acetyltransferase [Actinomycetes bacterium]
MEDLDLLIRTPRLDLHTVTPRDYELLAVDRADSKLWQGRGFSNPYGHLVDDPGPLPFRIPRIKKDPTLAKYLLRMAVYRPTNEIIGSAGFHDAPDSEGMIEIGLGLVPEFRGRGLAQELLHGMWGWVVDDPKVKVLRYTVSPENAPSQAIIKKFGFTYRGQQIDEEDGPEDIFEMSANQYRLKFRNGSVAE